MGKMLNVPKLGRPGFRTEVLFQKSCYAKERRTCFTVDQIMYLIYYYIESPVLTHSQPEAAIETLMCYLGIGDTFTPCHKDLCASSGQNLMCYTERDGSSFWFMTESSSAPAAAEYFRQKLGQELDNENHIVTIEELTNAPFKVFVLQQRLGDMVLVPPRSCHQVMNSGGITVKTSWSRMTLKGLSTAYHYELPIYRRQVIAAIKM